MIINPIVILSNDQSKRDKFIISLKIISIKKLTLNNKQNGLKNLLDSNFIVSLLSLFYFGIFFYWTISKTII